jgi:hypothetical protein
LQVGLGAEASTFGESFDDGAGVADLAGALGRMVRLHSNTNGLA